MLRCPGGACPIKVDCLRYRRIAYGRQSTFGTLPYDETTASCAHFVSIESVRPREDQVRERAYHLWIARGRADGAADADWSQARAELEASFLGELRPPE